MLTLLYALLKTTVMGTVTTKVSDCLITGAPPDESNTKEQIKMKKFLDKLRRQEQTIWQ